MTTTQNLIDEIGKSQFDEIMGEQATIDWDTQMDFKPQLKPYMAFSRNAGPQEAAFLVIHNNIRDAKRLAWKRCPIDFMEYTDLGIRLMRDNSILKLADQEKLRAGIPHAIDNPASCQHCELWGCGITSDNRCGECNQYPGDELVRRLTGSSTSKAKAAAARKNGRKGGRPKNET